jgi:hypothetical protein
MGIHTTTLSLLFLAAPPIQDGPAYHRSPEEIELFLKELEAALAPEADPKARALKIRSARSNVDAKVIALLDAKALRHEDRAVRDQAVDALGYMKHPDALEALTRMFARDEEELENEPPRYANLIRAIARKGEKKTIPLLVKDLFQHPDRGVIQMRILGLGNIRAKESVEELIQMMRSVGRARVSDHMLEMRTSLYMLTGVDKGTDQELWINWYGDNKNSLTIAPEPPEDSPKEILRCWSAFWGPERAKAKVSRGKK